MTVKDLKDLLEYFIEEGYSDYNLSYEGYPISPMYSVYEEGENPEKTIDFVKE